MQKKIWRLIIDDKKDQYYNMACDEAIAKFVGSADSLPTLRFYQWDPPTLSLGYFQKYKKEINYDFCKNNNIGIVRRITGGRAVLHDDEITYSISIPSSDPVFEKNLIESYKYIAQALAEGLKLLKLEPTFNQKKLPTEHSSSACFDAPSLYEITVNDKKIIGSAQKRFQTSFLQHGSIPFSIDIDKLFNCFIFPDNDIKERLKKSFINKATGINQETNRSITSNEAISAFIKGFETVLNIKFIQDTLSDAEKELINNDLYRKYSSEEWLNKY